MDGDEVDDDDDRDMFCIPPTPWANGVNGLRLENQITRLEHETADGKEKLIIE